MVNVAKFFVFIAIFYRYYLMFFWIVSNLLLWLEFFIRFPNGLIFLLTVIIFILHLLFDYFSFYELHEINLKGTSYYLISFLVVIVISLIDFLFDYLFILKIIAFNGGFFFIFKLEGKRVSTVISKLLYYFKKDLVLLSKFITILILIGISIFTFYIMALMVVYQKKLLP